MYQHFPNHLQKKGRKERQLLLELFPAPQTGPSLKYGAVTKADSFPHGNAVSHRPEHDVIRRHGFSTRSCLGKAH